MQQKRPLNIQDDYLDELRKNQSTVTIILKSGLPIHGIIRAVDSFAVLIEDRGKQHMVYKHALSTVLKGRLTSRRVPPKDSVSTRGM